MIEQIVMTVDIVVPLPDKSSLGFNNINLSLLQHQNKITKIQLRIK